MRRQQTEMLRPKIIGIKLERACKKWEVFCSKMKFWSKIKKWHSARHTNLDFGQKSKFDQKSNFWPEIKFLLKNQIIAQKSNFCSKIKVLLKKQFGQRLIVCTTIEN